MYRLLHSYDVTSLSWPQQRMQQSSDGKAKSLMTFIMVTFATRSEAERVQAQFDGWTYQGLELQVRPWQIPRKFLGASWDSGRGGGHFSGRDQGSAVGTNFE